jgi:outer membrane scaffolding protein for murein synthesis (MipA/OmpV family)
LTRLPIPALPLLAALALPLAAEESPLARVTLGFGAAAAPAYFGSGEATVGPAASLAIQEFVLPGGLGFGSEAALPTDPGFGIRGGFRYIPERDAADFDELEGLSRVDRAFELGAGLFRITDRTRAYAEVRKGFGGHDGWVGEGGIDVLLRPTDRLVLSAGPRAYLGDGAFMRTYFGVTPEEAARSSLAAFRPDGGIVSLGVELNARHYFAEDWSVLATLGWRRLRDDAARSPITREGSVDQYRARFLLSRTFSFGR